jgi:hypothetical protein
VIYFVHRLVYRINKTMASKIDPALWTDVFEVLASVAEAVPVLEAPLKGSIEALKQMRQYTEVSGFDRLTE